MIQAAPVSDRYQIGEALGDGGQGHVFMATDVENGESVVVKHIPTTQSPFSLGIREISALLSLKHPNIVQCLDFAYNRDRSVTIVYEYVAGGSLRSYLVEGQAVSPGFWEKCAVDLLSALVHLHQRNWVHRDLKPENVLIVSGTSETEPLFKLADLGLAAMTAFPGAVVRGNGGSPGYTAPEGFSGSMSASSDLYALGVILYEMASGHRPFDGDMRGLARAHAYDKPDFSCLQLPGVDAFISALLAKKPDDRPTSAAEALQFISPRQDPLPPSRSTQSWSADESPAVKPTTSRFGYGISTDTQIALTADSVAEFSIPAASRYEILEYRNCPYIVMVHPSHLEIRNGLTGAPTNRFIQKSGGNYQIHGYATILTVDAFHVRRWEAPWDKPTILIEIDEFEGKTMVAGDGIRAAWSQGERVCLLNLKQRGPAVIHHTSYSGLTPHLLFPDGNDGYIFVPGTLRPEVQLYDSGGNVQGTYTLPGPVFDVPSHSLPALLALPSENANQTLILVFFNDDLSITTHEVCISARMYSFVDDGFIYTDPNSDTWMIDRKHQWTRLQVPAASPRSILFSPSMKYFYSMESEEGRTLFKPHRGIYHE